MSSTENIARKSRFLSFVLRHKPESIGIDLDSAGWVDVGVLLEAAGKHGKNITLQELQLLVSSNDKKRFAFSADGSRIRASQGHSIDVELGYESAIPPNTLFHGTAERFVVSIKSEGLKKLARQHVHLTESKEIASSVGSRYGKLVLLVIDSKSMHEAGHLFFVSANNVWLTDHVPLDFINFPD